ncbi:biopolymer transport protein ExbB [Variibacter gotjawalensis]|uniref:Biopolymer transport protein ExbB n=1 Tax=Variibacter gotjawalensis TaxID=1333996 RepID=A0A0S3PZS0_9BRAD|nr:tonB-system energizer ExbB [Variibacter gotjawalensis]NIK47254.1 biopolymer transport protein ExbB [Variibacter gotjawalensis]RZS49154.1 outer membrane transport energization protein ExbB [Variibacter gotjawalensis]BAT61416.1 biopolymer transport protein ExbB [Variibacter gotjawalensis]
MRHSALRRSLGVFLAATLLAGHLFSPAVALAQTAPSAPAQQQPAAQPPAAPAPATPAPAAEEATETPSAIPAVLPHELTPWGMFMAADLVVKAVMIGLAFASLLTWTVWLAKGIELYSARLVAHRSLKALSQARDLHEGSETIGNRGTVRSLVNAAQLELDMSADLHEKEGIKDRIASRLSRIEAAAGRRISRGTGVLATIGSTAPFVGLFGTVWGIMNSFIGISKSQTTNLAVVAPGIAEALLATAIGLVAAIPAVMIYNVFARGITAYRAQLGDAAAEILRLVSRDLDREEAAAHQARSSRRMAAE